MPTPSRIVVVTATVRTDPDHPRYSDAGILRAVQEAVSDALRYKDGLENASDRVHVQFDRRRHP